MSLLKNTATIGGLTLVSRVAGFVRDMLSAQYLGAGLANDAFLIAWRLPNLFRALFAEGAFSSAFVPMFNREIGRSDGGMPAALGFADEVLAILFPIVLVLTILMMALAGPVVWLLTGGFPDGGPDKFALAVTLTRITFPYLALISLVSLLGGILNSVGRFWVNAAAPILLNLCMIAGLLFFRGHNAFETAHTQAVAVTISGVFQLGWLIWACDRAGTGLVFRRPRLNPKVRELLRIIWPAALGAGAVQFNLLISTGLAARFLPQGAVSYLYFADRLNQLPFALIGIGVGTAMLPGLSRQIGAGDQQGANTTMNRAIELVLVLALPATAALMIAATPIIRALLQHGAFTAEDARATGTALAAFSLGLPANIMIKVLVPGFYSRADTRTPVRIALIAMLANFLMNLVLIWPLAHIGLALSTALSCWINAGLLFVTLRKRGHFEVDPRLKRTAIRLGLATLAMAALLIAAGPLVDPHMTGNLFERVFWLAALMIVAAAVYFGVAILLGAFDWTEFKAQFSRRRRKAKA
jgi:putative peptidoglycan lipid II flippase